MLNSVKIHGLKKRNILNNRQRNAKRQVFVSAIFGYFCQDKYIPPPPTPILHFIKTNVRIYCLTSIYELNAQKYMYNECLDVKTYPQRSLVQHNA